MPYALNKLLPSLIIFLSFTQLSLHFWPDSAFVYGIRVDYLSPSLYLLDILIIIYLSVTKKLSLLASFSWLLLIIAFNLLFSLNPLSTLSWSFHLVIFLLFTRSQPPLPIIAYSLAGAMVFQTFLGLSQVLLGRTLQGPLYWLGERALNISSPNVAKWELFGELLLRPYGTFSHPNTLAGSLVVALLIIIHLRQKYKDLPRRLTILSCSVAVVGVILSQSAAAALSLFGLVIPFYLLRSLRLRLVYLLSLFFAVALFFTPPSPTALSVVERLNLQRVSLDVISRYPVFGTGAMASLTAYPGVYPPHRLLQPDHNSFTLFFSWFGLSGIFFIIYIFRAFLISKLKFLIVISPLLPLLLFDHYLLTSIQGLFIFLLYLRISFAPPPRLHDLL